MKMKYILPLLLLFSVSMFGQGNKNKRDQVKALKVSYLTTQLDLSSDEAAKFWPVYNAFEEKHFTLRHDRMRPLVRKIDEMGNATDKEAAACLDQLQDLEKEIFTLRQKLVADLKPVIGPLKILKLKKAEEDFNKQLLHKYKGKKK